MNLQFTPDQQRDLDRLDRNARRIVDPRTQEAYILVPESDYETMKELQDDALREEAIQAVALQNAANRLNDLP